MYEQLATNAGNAICKNIQAIDSKLHASNRALCFFLISIVAWITWCAIAIFWV